jgi:acyl carrier protein
MDIEKRVEGFITENFYVADPALLGPRTSLYEHGIVDSTGLLEVVAFLEKEFGIEVLDEEVTPENLDNLERISAYVARKRCA